MTHISDHCQAQVFDLIAAVYKRAMLDAKRGDPRAARWLDITAPDWREKCMTKQPNQPKITEVSR